MTIKKDFLTKLKKDYITLLNIGAVVINLVAIFVSNMPMWSFLMMVISSGVVYYRLSNDSYSKELEVKEALKVEAKEVPERTHFEVKD